MTQGAISRRGKSWNLRWDKPRLSDGKRRQGFKSVRGTKPEAQKELRRLLANQDKGVVFAPHKTILAEWLTEWLDTVVSRRVRPVTLQGYGSYVRRHLSPHLGHLKLQLIGPTHIERMLVAMEESGLTANTARHAFVVLQKALKDAERRGLIDANPCRLVDPPAVDDFHVEPPTAMVIAEIIANVESDGFATVFKLMAATGLRRGEAVALQWSALDLGSRVLSVVQTAQRIRAGSITVMPPKTKSGMRGVAIDDATTNMLRTHRVSQQERILRSLGTIEDAGFVFPDPFGQLADPDHFTRTWRKAAKAAGHSKVRLHDVRHHHATTLMALGVNAKVVQERLGHSTPAFTLQRYSHVSEGMQAEAARLYGEESGAALSG